MKHNIKSYRDFNLLNEKNVIKDKAEYLLNKLFPNKLVDPNMLTTYLVNQLKKNGIIHLRDYIITFEDKYHLDAIITVTDKKSGRSVIKWSDSFKKATIIECVEAAIYELD